MYEIYAGSQLIFSDITPTEACKVLNPKLTLEDNSAGSLEFTLPPGNVGYNSIVCLTTECVVKKDGTEIWRGRVISENIDFWKNKKYTCEGELAYLVDTIQPPARYNVDNTTISSFLGSLLTQHNSQVNGISNFKKFTKGSVTVQDGDQQVDDDAINRYTNFENTLDCINDKLVSRLGGHLRIRHVGNTDLPVDGVNHIRYLDYIADEYVGTCNQEITFGSNLLDYVSDISAMDWATVVVPKGARLELEEDQQPVQGLEAYLTGAKSNISDSWHAANSIYVKNPTAVQEKGYICTVIEFSNIGEGAGTDTTALQTAANNLVKKAKRYLEDLYTNRFNKVSLTISAVDLHYLNPAIESFELLEKVRCISDPHNMNTEFPVTKIELDMLNPANTTYTLGTDVHTTLSSASNRTDTDLANYVSETYVPVESVVLSSAKEDARQLIEGSAKGGVASWLYDLQRDTGDHNNMNSIIDQSVDPTTGLGRVPIGVRIADGATDRIARNRWLFTNGGLGHYYKYSSGVNKDKWAPINIGITMDGRIVADMITTGCIKLTGVAERNEGSWTPSSVKQTFLKVYSSTTPSDATVIGRWGSDGIWIGKGSLTLGSISSIVPSDNPNKYGFYEYSGGKYVKTNDTAVQSGKAYYAYPAQIDNNGRSIFRNAYVVGTIYGSDIKGSTFRTVATNNKQVYIHEDAIEVFNTTNNGSGYVRCFQGSINPDDGRYDYEFGIASSMCHVVYYRDGHHTHEEVEPEWIIRVAKWFKEDND